MKKYTLLFLFLLSFVVLSAQSFHMRKMDFRRGGSYSDKNIVTDSRGHLHYENGRVRASLSEDIFDNKIYKDSRGNEATYSKEVWRDVFREFNGDERKILVWLTDAFSDLENTREKYKMNIHGNLEYEFNHFRASLSTDIFDSGVYKDNNDNEIKYSKEFWQDMIDAYRGNKMSIFQSFLDSYYSKRNLRDEYKMDIFGNRIYSNNRGGKASLSKNTHNEMIYEDSDDNYVAFSNKTWRNLQNRHGSANDIFLSLLSKFLLD